jgi:hypothetical protein
MKSWKPPILYSKLPLDFRAAGRFPDCNDWIFSSDPVIKPQFSSLYMKKLSRLNTLKTLRSYKVLRPFIKPNQRPPAELGV